MPTGHLHPGFYSRLLSVEVESEMGRAVISVTAFFLKHGVEEWLLAEIGPLIEASRQLSGCLSFDLYQLQEDKHTFMLHETWETEEAHRDYSLSPLKTELASVFAPCLAQPMQTWHVEEICANATEDAGEVSTGRNSL